MLYPKLGRGCVLSFRHQSVSSPISSQTHPLHAQAGARSSVATGFVPHRGTQFRRRRVRWSDTLQAGRRHGAMARALDGPMADRPELSWLVEGRPATDCQAAGTGLPVDRAGRGHRQGMGRGPAVVSRTVRRRVLKARGMLCSGRRAQLPRRALLGGEARAHRSPPAAAWRHPSARATSIRVDGA